MKTLWTSKLLIMAVLCLTLNADNNASKCETELKVRRHSVFNITVKHQVKMQCPVVHVCDGKPNITWFKLQTMDYEPVNMSDSVTTEWVDINDTQGISFLIFKNVLRHHSGLYQCSSGLAVSHSIILNVIGDESDTVNRTLPDQTNSRTPHNPDDKNKWLYMYSAVGIGGIVIIVIVISVLGMRGCNGKAKKESQCENQCMDVSMIEQRQHHSSNQALPRGSPRDPPSHRTSRKKKSPSPAPQRDNVYGQIDGDRERQRHGPVEEGSSVVYAALNHQHLAAATPRSRMVVEESSEYAAIRVS